MLFIIATTICKFLCIICICSFVLTLTVHMALLSEPTLFFAYFVCTASAISVCMMVLIPLLYLISYAFWGRSGGVWPISLAALLLVGFTVIFVGAVAHAVLGDFFLAWFFPDYGLAVYV